jgi:hypothetical protein
VVDHLRRGGSACLERRDEMGVNQVAELRAGYAQDRLAGQSRGTRTVDQDVDAPEFVYAPVDQRVGDLGVRRRPRVRDRAVDAVGRFGRCLGVPAIDDDARALFGEKFGDRAPDTARTADDDGAAPGQRVANRRRRP